MMGNQIIYFMSNEVIVGHTKVGSFDFHMPWHKGNQVEIEKECFSIVRSYEPKYGVQCVLVEPLFWSQLEGELDEGKRR